MTGTEMFDAIAYIDEDLIDRCLAVKAVKAADKAVTADKGAAVRRRRWAPYAALAAVLVLAIALAAALRLGRRSPVPDEIPGTHTETEAPTPSPTFVLETPSPENAKFIGAWAGTDMSLCLKENGSYDIYTKGEDGKYVYASSGYYYIGGETLALYDPDRNEYKESAVAFGEDEDHLILTDADGTTRYERVDLNALWEPDQPEGYVKSPELAVMALDSLEYGRDYISLYDKFGKDISCDDVQIEDGTGLGMIVADGKTYYLGLDFLAKAMVNNTLTLSAQTGEYGSARDAFVFWWKLYVNRFNYLLPETPLYVNEYYNVYNTGIKGVEETPINPYRNQAQALIDWTSEKEDNSITIGSSSLETCLRYPGFNLNYDYTSVVKELNYLTNGLELASRTGDGEVIWNPTVVESHELKPNGDGTCTITLRIREGLRFSDAREVGVMDYLAMPVVCMTPVYEEAVGTETETYHPNPSRTLAGPGFIAADDPFRLYDGNSGDGVLHCFRIVDNRTFSMILPAELAEYYYFPAYFTMFTAQPAEAWLCGAELKDDGEGVYLTPDFYEMDGAGFKHARELLELCTDNSAEAFGKHPWSGPYYPVGVLPESYGDIGGYVLKRNPHYAGAYNGSIPSIETVNYTRATPTMQTMDLIEGRIDLLTGICGQSETDEVLRIVEGSGGAFACTHYSRAGYGKYSFRADLGPAQFGSVRRALAYCMDRVEFASDFTGGYGSVISAPYSRDHFAYKDAVGTSSMWKQNEYEPSLEKAIAELETDGWVWGENGESYTEGVRYKRIPLELVRERDREYAALDGSIKGYEKDGYFYMPLVLNMFMTPESYGPEIELGFFAEDSLAREAGIRMMNTLGDFTGMLDELYERPQYGHYDGKPTYNLFRFASSFTSHVYDRSGIHTIDPALYDSKSEFYLKDYYDIYMLDQP